MDGRTPEAPLASEILTSTEYAYPIFRIPRIQDNHGLLIF